jgi:hypothetical protein
MNIGPVAHHNTHARFPDLGFEGELAYSPAILTQTHKTPYRCIHHE